MAKYTFLDLALDVLASKQTPLTVEQNVKRPDSALMKIGAWPARFILKANAEHLTGLELESFQSIEQEETTETPKFLEKHLHPYLVCFAASEFSRFDVTCKTICHGKSTKKGAKTNEWLHPDIVGFSLNQEFDTVLTNEELAGTLQPSE